MSSTLPLFSLPPFLWQALTSFVTRHTGGLVFAGSLIVLLHYLFSRDNTQDVARYYRALQPNSKLIKAFEEERDTAEQVALVTFQGGACECTCSRTTLRLRSHATKDILCTVFIRDIVGVALRSDQGVRTRVCVTFYPSVPMKGGGWWLPRRSAPRLQRRRKELFITLGSTADAYLWLRILRTAVRGGDISRDAMQGTGGGGILPAGRAYAVIINPRAGPGPGHAQAVWHHVQPILDKADGLEYEVCESEGPGHIVEICQHLNDRHCSGIIVVGGDDSVVEVIRGLSQRHASPAGVDGMRGTGEGEDGGSYEVHGPGYSSDTDGAGGPAPSLEVDISMLQVPIGIIPAGQHNHLACSLGLTDAVTAAVAIAQGAVCTHSGLVVTIKYNGNHPEDAILVPHSVQVYGNHGQGEREPIEWPCLDPNPRPSSPWWYPQRWLQAWRQWSSMRTLKQELEVQVQCPTPGKDPPGLVPDNTVHVEVLPPLAPCHGTQLLSLHTHSTRDLQRHCLSGASETGVTMATQGVIITTHSINSSRHNRVWDSDADDDAHAADGDADASRSPLTVQVSGEVLTSDARQVGITAVPQTLLWITRPCIERTDVPVHVQSSPGTSQ